MSLLDVTNWNDIQVEDAQNDKKFSELGLVDAAKESTKGVDFILPSAKEAMQKASSLRKVQIPVLKDQQVKVVLTPGFENIPSNLPESDKFSFTAVDVFSGFRHYPAQFDNNSMDADWTKQNVMKNVAHGMGKTVEGIIASVLETRKTQTLDYLTQVSQGDGTFTFDGATDTLSVSKSAQKETMFDNLEELMEANELGGNYRVVTNRGGLAVQRTEMLKYGAGNDKNLQALRQMQADRMHTSKSISAGADVFNGYLLRDGAVGLIENFPYDFRKNTKLEDGRKWSITDMELPFARMRANIYTNNQATEATALVKTGRDSNLIMTHFQEMAIWLRFFVVYRYNDDLANKANDIVKIKGLTV